MFLRQELGLNPDAEIGRYLTDKADFHHIPPFAGSIEYETGAADSATVAMLQGLVANDGDGWQWTLKELDRYFERCASLAFPVHAQAEISNSLECAGSPASGFARERVGAYLDGALALGCRTAELHAALASPTDDPAFIPQPMASEEFEQLLINAHRHASRVLDALSKRLPYLPGETATAGSAVTGQRRRILNRIEVLSQTAVRGWRIRIHGDYHLGQVLRTGYDFVILDFEGEPARPLADRRAKQSPLKDVAGTLRSFSYAAYMSLSNHAAQRPNDITRLEPWAKLWERAVSREFLCAYRETALASSALAIGDADFRKLLDLFLIDKALYEVLYELNARPEWVRIPLMGLLTLTSA